MIQNQVIFIGATKEDFLNDLRTIVREEILLSTPNTKPEKKFLTLPEASEFLGLSRSTIYRMTSENKIPHTKRGKLFFVRDELTRWVQEGSNSIIQTR